MHLQSIKSGARETLFHRFDADCMRRNVERCLHFQIDTLRCIKTRAMQRLWIQNAFLAGPHLNACGCETCAGEKVLVFCQWEDLKKHIAETLETMRVPHLQLSGNIYKRSDILRRFQDRITCPHLSIASYSSKMQRERFRDDID